MAAPTSLVFKVTRAEPELVRPAKPTPHESKHLSDIDDQGGLRMHIQVIEFYRSNPLMRGRDPVKVVRDALAQTLVYYYPFAGRLREGPGGKLIVECTGEGIMFTEADADVTLEQFGDAPLSPPFPCIEELNYIVPGSGDLLGCPLLHIQVTRLKCGGFIFALRLNHTMADAAGLVQFMTAIGEMARGNPTLSVLPVWRRELLKARDPPRVTCTHREYDQVPDPYGSLSLNDMPRRTFFFGPAAFSTLRQSLPSHLRACSTFELLTAYTWRCRTIAAQLDPADETRVTFFVNARAGFNPPLPAGYYGNVIAFSTALTTADKLVQNPLGYALELVRKAKNNVTHEYMKSVADFMVMNGRPGGYPPTMKNYFVSDVTRARFEEVDFGWGKAVYGGPAKVGIDDAPEFGSFLIPFTNKRGEKGVVVPISLPSQAMERFAKELDNILKDHPIGSTTSTFISSAM